jgi:transketolase
LSSSRFTGGLPRRTETRLTFDGVGDFEAGQYEGRNFHFGIREHGMGAIVNGMTLSKVRAYGSTFFIFTDYMKPPMRLSALMEIPAIWIYTHDSIGLGEDGPTHQSIETVGDHEGGSSSDAASPGRCE